MMMVMNIMIMITIDENDDPDWIDENDDHDDHDWIDDPDYNW